MADLLQFLQYTIVNLSSFLSGKLLVSDKESEGENKEDRNNKVGEDQQPAEASSSKDE